MRVLLIFLDGVGLGGDNAAHNPFSTANLPTLHRLTNGQHWLNTAGKHRTERTLFIPTDPRMGIPGRPQSGSGQAAIVTGRNIPQITGEHYGPKPNKAIRDLLDEGSIFSDVIKAGKTAALLEAYPPMWHQGINSGKRLPASYQYAARAAALPFMTVDDLRAERALSGDWTNEGWNRQLQVEIPTITPFEAGVHLVEIARNYDFAFMAHWMTDIVGHRGPLEEAVKLLETFDAVLSGVLKTWQDDEGLVIVTSDHGNIENLSQRQHTENDVPTVVIGDEKDAFSEIHQLSDIVPIIRKIMEISSTYA